jgi:thiosulfate/3-mercaptopyruvate sulfurtransferase
MHLITPAELKTCPESTLLLDARPGPDYAAGHLVGALHADLNRDLSDASEPDHDPARGGRHPLPSPRRFAALLGAWGVGPDTDVVVYDARDGGNAGARLWWMLRALGHGRARLLDGGLKAAVAEGWPTTQDSTSPRPLAAYPADRWTWPLVDADAVEAQRQDPGRRVLDVRSAERWRGDSEPFDPVPGRIPGSVNLPWTENLEPDGRYKSPAALRAQYEALLAGTPIERLTVHCGSGVTACQTLLALEVAGLSGAALYVGSWSEWCRSGRPSLPERA